MIDDIKDKWNRLSFDTKGNFLLFIGACLIFTMINLTITGINNKPIPDKISLTNGEKILKVLKNSEIREDCEIDFISYSGISFCTNKIAIEYLSSRDDIYRISVYEENLFSKDNSYTLNLKLDEEIKIKEYLDKYKEEKSKKQIDKILGDL